MSPRPVVILTLTIAHALWPLGASGESDERDQRKLQGTWTAKSIAFHGRQTLGDPITDLRLVVAGNQIRLEGKGPELENYASFGYNLDPAKTPKTIDITITAGESKGTVMHGIYELNDDEWKLCVQLIGGNRPSAFKSSADSQDVVAVFTRAKD